jgi:hypothetical protein
MELGGKVLTCKLWSQKGVTGPKACVSTIEVSNMLLKSFNKKCRDISCNGTGQGLHASDENITFLLQSSGLIS